jgi:uncharacterized SAM-binding protein YcdF (DUF218 family)
VILKRHNFPEDQAQDPKASGFFPVPLFSVATLPPDLLVDGLIVLGARLSPQGEPGRVARLRLVHALNLWRHWEGRIYVILSGGRHAGDVCSEAKGMANWALAWAREHWGEEVSEALEACLILEEASLNTATSARHTLALAQARRSRAVGLVTDAVHIHRARFLFQRQFSPRGIRVQPLAVRGLVRHYWRRRRYLGLGKIALREGGAWLKVLGWLALRRP